MGRNEELEISPRQRLIGNITAGTCVILCGLFLLLCGVNVIPLKVTEVLIASLLFAVGLVLFSSGLIQKNSVSLWLSIAFIMPGVVEVLAKYTALDYCNLYPIYIATPAICSLITMLLSHEFRDNLYVVGIFGVFAAIFSLQSSGLLGWSVVLPILVIYVGAIIVLGAVKLNKKEKEE